MQRGLISRQLRLHPPQRSADRYWFSVGGLLPVASLPEVIVWDESVWLEVLSAAEICWPDVLPDGAIASPPQREPRPCLPE
jgi:hypothetical protein